MEEPTTQQRSTRPSLSYTIRQIHRRADSVNGAGGCALATATFPGRGPLKLRCFACSRFARVGEYLHHYESLLAHALRRAYPHTLTRARASSLAAAFTRSVLRPIATAHRCPTGPVASVYAISFSVDLSGARPGTRPAAVMPLIDLVMARADEEIEKRGRFDGSWKADDHECAICMDHIETPWKSVRLPCSHMFHEGCLDRWFRTNHVCPLCRYRMPTA